MLRGFLGFAPTVDGCVIDPKLPKDFPSLTIDRIRVKGLVLAVTASADAIVVRKISGDSNGLFTIAAPGFKSVPPIDWARTSEVRLTR
jgi:hypothetical protein